MAGLVSLRPDDDALSQRERVSCDAGQSMTLLESTRPLLILFVDEPTSEGAKWRDRETCRLGNLFQTVHVDPEHRDIRRKGGLRERHALNEFGEPIHPFAFATPPVLRTLSDVDEEPVLNVEEASPLVRFGHGRGSTQRGAESDAIR